MVATAIQLAKIDVRIQGLPPGLLMACKEIMVHQEKLKKGQRLTRELEARYHTHWGTVGKKQVAGIPWVNVYKCLCAAAVRFKEGRGAMTQLVAATVSCETDFISLGTDQYEVYTDWVRIPPKTGGLVQIARPRFREWSASFTMIVDTEFYKNVAILEDVLGTAGKMVGLGPNRPALKGPYGRFVVERFEIR
jgi:hypothetical protein